MRARPFINSAVVGIAWAVAASCNTGLAGPNGAVASIQVTAAVDSAFALGDTVPFHATATDRAGATLSGVTYTWTSSAPDVATVSKDGMVVAVANGAATIQATANGVTGSAPFAVRQVAVGLTFALTLDTIATIGHTVQGLADRIDATGHPVPGDTVRWVSSDPAVATVDDTGLVRGIANGRAVIYAAVGDFNDSATVTVHQYAALIHHAVPSGPYPTRGQAGEIVGWVELVVQDSAQHVLTTDNSTIIRAAIDSGAGVLTGRLEMPLTGGYVVFDSLVISGVVGARILSFTVEGTPVRDTVTAEIWNGPPAAIYAVSGNGQSGPPGTTLDLPLKVKVVDAFGNAVRARIAWSVISDSGAVGAGSTDTDSYGIAFTTYRLGLTVGTDTVYATMDGTPGSPVTFVETVTPPSSGTTGAPRRQ